MKTPIFSGFHYNITKILHCSPIFYTSHNTYINSIGMSNPHKLYCLVYAHLFIWEVFTFQCKNVMNRLFSTILLKFRVLDHYIFCNGFVMKMGCFVMKVLLLLVSCNEFVMENVMKKRGVLK